jgi:aspartate aminotransferase-like enzyme
MEGSIRNVVKTKVLNCMNGAFSDKWNDVALRCGKQATAPSSSSGASPSTRRPCAGAGQGRLRRHHAHPQRDLVRLHERPAGPHGGRREFPEVISIVDVVSSFSALPIPKDELGIDVMITGSQKALALPPGLSLVSVSKRALERAAGVADRGYYFDLLEFQKNHENGMTPSTPIIPIIYALKSKLEDIKAEGGAARYARHARLNKARPRLGPRQGLQAIPEGGLRLGHAQLLREQPQLRPPALNKILKAKHQLVIDGGYGKLKGKTFRISNMGDETDETIADLIKALDSALAETPKVAA